MHAVVLSLIAEIAEAGRPSGWLAEKRFAATL